MPLNKETEPEYTLSRFKTAQVESFILADMIYASSTSLEFQLVCLVKLEHTLDFIMYCSGLVYGAGCRSYVAGLTPAGSRNDNGGFDRQSIGHFPVLEINRMKSFCVFFLKVCYTLVYRIVTW